ncbi:MAG TPA: hypothetical protein VLD65_12665, partial [Anaerolineales bacterium]|nr:hypothetical protein [Anaerolineales bacterium]
MKRASFNSDWYFYKEETHAEKRMVGPLTLPHDAMLQEMRDPEAKNGFNTGYFPGGIYHYIKGFYVPKEYQDKNV